MHHPTKPSLSFLLLHVNFFLFMLERTNICGLLQPCVSLSARQSILTNINNTTTKTRRHFHFFALTGGRVSRMDLLEKKNDFSKLQETKSAGNMLPFTHSPSSHSQCVLLTALATPSQTETPPPPTTRCSFTVCSFSNTSGETTNKQINSIELTDVGRVSRSGNSTCIFVGCVLFGALGQCNRLITHRN